jgi:hypothetical protein
LQAVLAGGLPGQELHVRAWRARLEGHRWDLQDADVQLLRTRLLQEGRPLQPRAWTRRPQAACDCRSSSERTGSDDDAVDAIDSDAEDGRDVPTRRFRHAIFYEGMEEPIASHRVARR